MPGKTASRDSAEAISRVYLFTGEADLRRRDAVQKLVGKLVDPSSEGFDFDVVDGEEASSAGILSSVTTAPFMSERKVVLVERVDRLSQDDQEKIAAFIPKLPSLSCLILLAGDDGSSRSKPSQSKPKQSGDGDDAEEEPDRKQKKGLSPTLQKAVKAHGSVTNFAKMKGEEMAHTAVMQAGRLGKKLEAGAAAVLSRSVEGSATLLEREIEKLATYIGERDTIRMEDVEAVASRSPEDRVFALIDAIGARKTGDAMSLLDETLAASPKPEGEVLRILALMARHFRMLYQLRYLRDAGVRQFGSLPEEIAELLPKEPSVLSLADWQRNKLSAQLSCFSAAQLVQCLRGVLDCELAAKGLGAETSTNRLSLEVLLARLCGANQRP